MLAPLIVAGRFLTVLPIPRREGEEAIPLGRAAWWFPAVGLLLGAALVGIDRLVSLAFPPLLSVGLVLALWKIATGGIHLDGLADCLDGLAGQDVERRRAIMRDSRVGTFGAAGLVLCLLLEFLALAALPSMVRGRLLLLAPVVGRLAPLLIGPCLRAATPGQGIGAAFLAATSRRAGPVLLVAVGGLAIWVLGTWAAVIVLCGLAMSALAAAAFARRFGGVTGDVLGASVELCELGVLLAGACLAHRGLL
jgi:adenosylcobinamide-GDP ribazoletransferase